MNDATTIFRIKKRTNPFVQIDKTVLEDPRLTWKAKGLLGYLLSRPDDWQINLGDLSNRSKDGRSAVQTAMKELEVLGYAVRRKLRGEGGRLAGERWLVFEQPLPPGSEVDEHGNVVGSLGLEVDRREENRLPENPTPDKPAAGKSPTTKKELTNKEKEGGGETLVGKGPSRAPSEQPWFAALWAEHPHASSLAFTQAWAKWEEFRRRGRKPISKMAAEMQLKKLGEVPWPDAVEAIETSIRNDWTGLFPKKSEARRPARAVFNEDQYDGPMFGEGAQ